MRAYHTFLCPRRHTTLSASPWGGVATMSPRRRQGTCCRFPLGNKVAHNRLEATHAGSHARWQLSREEAQGHQAIEEILPKRERIAHDVKNLRTQPSIYLIKSYGILCCLVCQ